MNPSGWHVDLHTHSTFSDGELTPAELVRRAKGMNLRAIALTDHDNIGGVAEAVETGLEEGIEVIPGIELSVEYGGFKEVHLLGYYIDWRNPQMKEKLQNFQEVRESRGEKILLRINDHLVRQGLPPLDFAEVRARAGGSVGRPHIAQELVERGLADRINDAFERYLVPYNVPKAYFTPSEAVEMIHEARGVVVLAHPMVLAREPAVLERMVSGLKELGIVGVEAYYGDFAETEISACCQVARSHGLVVTGGSDFHGEGFPYALGRLRDGQPISYEVVVGLRRAYFALHPVVVGITGLDEDLLGGLAERAAIEIGAEYQPGGLRAVVAETNSGARRRRSVVTWIDNEALAEEAILRECAMSRGIKACLVRYEDDMELPSLARKSGWVQQDLRSNMLALRLSRDQVRAEPLQVAAQHLLHMVSLFL